MKEDREKFAKEKLMFNYPHASEAIVADIKRKRRTTFGKFAEFQSSIS